jgi:photosystem II stability/assembly factor-like uncharacterized protein
VGNGFPFNSANVAGEVQGLAPIDWGDATVSLFASIQRHSVYRPDDGGLSWRPKVTGPSTQRRSQPGLVASGSTLFYAGWDAGGSAGVFRSSDGGDTWAVVNTGLGADAAARAAITAVHVCEGSLFTSINRDGIYRSDNAGDSWTRKNAGIFHVGPTQTSFAEGAAGTYRSVDSGESWVASHGGIHHALVNDILWHGGSLYAATSAGVAFSIDEVAAGTTSATVAGLTDGTSYTAYVTLVDGEHSVLPTPVEDSVTGVDLTLT